MSKIKDALIDQMNDTPTHFWGYIIVGVINRTTWERGWKIVGLWGDEDKNEGNRIGPTFAEADFDACEKLLDELVKKYGCPVPIQTIIQHFENTQLVTSH